MSSPSESRCVSCDAELAGGFCHVCGEQARRDPPTLVRFVGELIGELLDADGRVVKTVKTLVLRPGRLTAEYIRGCRKPYLGPAAVFVLMNVLFFFVQPLANVNTFHATLESQTNWYPYSDWAEALVADKLASSGTDREAYARDFDAASERYARTLIFVQVPLLALGVMLVNIRQRRYFIEHVVFATHFLAAFLLLCVVTSFGIFFYWRLGLGNSFNLELPFMLLIMAYLVPATREVYGDTWVAAFLKAFLLLLANLVVINLFRLVLFLVTYWSVP